MPSLRVHFLPELIAPDDLAASTCVVIDVLRATTTIIAALAAEARAVIPCLTIEDARRAAAALPAGESILGGERRGLPIEGFALGNSPTEYTRQSVGGKTVVLTTTNGTKTLLHCRQAADVLLAGFVNLSASCRLLRDRQHIDIVCAGTDGEIGRDDVLVAGALVAGLATTGTWQLNDQAAVSRDAWLQIVGLSTQHSLADHIITAMRHSQGGRNLIEIGLDGDIALAAALDRYQIVPKFDAISGQIKSV